MDETEREVLAGIPPEALTVHLTRSTIRMHHGASWRVDKSNDTHDLIVCLAGSATYEVDGHVLDLSPGHAMLVPARHRFRGRRTSDEQYTGIAQHFTLKLFGNVDLIPQMDLRRQARLTGWSYLEPLVRHFHDTAPRTSTTLIQHHAFMVILGAFIEDAFLGWRDSAMASNENRDALSLHVMLAAARISADPLQTDILESVIARVPYNAEYFRRAFRNRLGYTPQKFVELKKLERAVHFLALGRSVKETADDLGYRDPYYFSRIFKKYIGASPSSYRPKSKGKRHLQEEFFIA